MNKDYDWKLFAWAIDFVRCVEEFPRWKKWILRFVLGRYASREYVGLREHLDSQWEFGSQVGYDIREASYHKEKWNWIKHKS